MTESRVLSFKIAEKLDIPKDEIVGWYNLKDGGYVSGKMCPVLQCTKDDPRIRYIPTTDCLGVGSMLPDEVDGYELRIKKIRFAWNVVYYKENFPCKDDLLNEISIIDESLTEALGLMLVKLREEGLNGESN